MEQLLLPLPYVPRYDASKWFVGAYNRIATEHVLSWPKGWYHHFLWIYGTPGSGKTHLAHVWAEQANAKTYTLHHILTKIHIEPLQPGKAYVIDDVDNTDSQEDEEKLFHFYNDAYEKKAWVLWVSPLPPSHLCILLPDLRSRLNAIPVFHLQAPSDEDLYHIISQQSFLRGFTLPSHCIQFLLNHIERSPSSIRFWIELIDQSLAREKKAPSLSFLKTLLFPSG